MKKLWLILCIMCICLSTSGCKKDNMEILTENIEVIEQDKVSVPKEKSDNLEEKEEISKEEKKYDLGSLTMERSGEHSASPKSSSVKDINTKGEKKKKNEKKKSAEPAKKETSTPKAGEEGDMKETDYAFVDEDTGDADNEVTEKTSDLIFLDYVNLITSDFPLNKVDSILARISAPIIKEYGSGDYIYGMSDYTLRGKQKATFKITGKDGKVFKVSIEKYKDDFKVRVKKL